MRSLFRKELGSFLGSVTGYVVICVFLIITSLFLWIFPGEMNLPEAGYATLDGLFIVAPWVFLFLVPAISMRMLAEEKKTGTIELLLTRPLSDLQIVSSKFLASVVLILFSIIPTFIYFYSIVKLGNPQGNIDLGATWGSYIGLFFLASVYASVGLFASSLTDNQIISFLLGVLLSFLIFTGFDYLASIFETSEFNTFILNLGINEHYNSISRGVVDSRDIIYFLSVVVLFLVLTQFNLRSKSGQTELSIKNLIKSRIIFIFLIIVAFNYLAKQFFFRLDLTTDKRFTLAQPTKKYLKELDDVVYVKIYLDGELPIGFTKLKNSIKEMLDEFRVYTDNIEYNFINPYDIIDNNEKKALFRELYEKGVEPTNIRINEEEGLTQKNIFPGAIVSYKNVETSINLLSNNPGLPAEVNLNNSVQGLEYSFISIIKNITSTKVEKIVFLEGQGELNEYEVGDITKSLANYYQVDRGALHGRPGVLDDYKAVVIAKPTKPFNEKDKFALDQYLMQGGKILYFIDAVNVNIDSLVYGSTLALIDDLNLTDQLFNYGVRVNPVLIKDLQSNFISVNTAPVGSPAKFTPVPWYYYPMISGKPEHPITRNLNMVKTEYVNYIDTVEGAGNLNKKSLLWTSRQTGILNVPAKISLGEIDLKPNPAFYNAGPKPIAVLVEGEFGSAFKNRMLEPILGYKPDKFLDHSKKTGILVVSDGDIIRNDVKYSPKGNMIYKLGYDRNTNHTFGNKEFVLNAVNYLTDEDGLINLRSREYKLRLLDKQKLLEEKKFWIMLNILLPVILVVLFGLVSNFIRKRKYS